jgi:hypothetical protein
MSFRHFKCQRGRRGPDRMVIGFTPGTPVSPTNKTYHHDITKILLKVALSTITLTLKSQSSILMYYWGNQIDLSKIRDH